MCRSCLRKLLQRNLILPESALVPWSNERPLENKELNAIIGAWDALLICLTRALLDASFMANYLLEIRSLVKLLTFLILQSNDATYTILKPLGLIPDIEPSEPWTDSFEPLAPRTEPASND
ncbi:hypothetical protein Tco_0616394 [Tanacetum coccineum]